MILWREVTGFVEGDGITLNGTTEYTESLPIASINQLVKEHVSTGDFQILLSANSRLVFIISFIDSQWRKDETSHLFIIGKYPNKVNYLLTDTEHRLCKRWKCNVNLSKRLRPIDIPL